MCAFTACVRFLRRRGPAGLRNILFGLPMLYFSRSAHGDFCVCEVGVVSLPPACFACCRNAGRPLVKAAHLSLSEVAEQHSLRGHFFC